MAKSTELTAKDLGNLAIMPQGLDNQYIPPSHLKNILRSKKSRDNIRFDFSKDIEAEYLRSLLYGEQVLMNRAFMINTPEVYKNFQEDSKDRQIFMDLIGSKAIVPWLYLERSLDQKPEFGIDPDGWDAVCSLVRDYKDIPAIRLSWDDDENIRRTNQLSNTYTNYIMSMPIVADKIAKDFVANNFGVQKGQEERFRKQIGEVTKFCVDVFNQTGRSFITRNQLYQKFVCVDKTPIPEGHYDIDKPFAMALKILFDLKYEVNLPDAFGIQALTGRDLPSRTALYELDMKLAGQGEAVSLDIPDLIGNLVFGEVQQGLWLKSINYLGLADVQKARNSDEWKELMRSSRSINNQARNAVQKGKFDTSLDFLSFWKAFLSYQRKLSSMVTEKMKGEVQPSVDVLVRMGSVAVQVSPFGKIAKIFGDGNSLKDDVTSLVTGIAVGVQGEFQTDLGYNFEFMRTKLNGARDQFEGLRKQLLKNGYQIDVTDYLEPRRESAMADAADFFGL